MGCVPEGFVNCPSWLEKSISSKIPSFCIHIKLLHIHDLPLSLLHKRIVQLLHIKEPSQHVILIVELPVKAILFQECVNRLLRAASRISSTLPSFSVPMCRSRMNKHSIWISRPWKTTEEAIKQSKFLSKSDHYRDVLRVPHA